MRPLVYFNSKGSYPIASIFDMFTFCGIINEVRHRREGIEGGGGGCGPFLGGGGWVQFFLENEVL